MTEVTGTSHAPFIKASDIKTHKLEVKTLCLRDLYFNLCRLLLNDHNTNNTLSESKN